MLFAYWEKETLEQVILQEIEIVYDFLIRFLVVRQMERGFHFVECVNRIFYPKSSSWTNVVF